MYERHFGLNSRPFGPKAQGAGVFVGPQQSKIINNLNKALDARDAVATVTGPVGVGKTTVVRRTLESVSPGRMVAWIGRLQLAPDEVLELLLASSGIRRQKKGTIQRFAAFRRLLHERAAAGTRVTIVVEDAHRIGSDTLAELETLTAADAGDNTSANIILMGPPELHDLLSTPDLVRMKQRNRLRQDVQAFSLPEVRGYLKHSLRQAGGDSDQIIEKGVAGIVFDCSEGIPRVINTLCETALTAAAEDNFNRVTPALMRQVAFNAFGYETDSVEIDPATPGVQYDKVEPLANVPLPSDADAMIDRETPPVAEVRNKPGTEHPVAIESDHLPAKSASGAAEPAEAIDDFDEDNIPHLINDTQPEIPTLYSEESGNPAPETDRPDEDKFDLTAALLPETDETNVMPGLSPQKDSAARDVRQAEVQNSGKKAESTPTLESFVAPDPLPDTSSTTPADHELTDNEDMLRTTHNWTEDKPVVEFDLPTIPEPEPAAMGSGPDPFRESVAMRIDMLHAIKDRPGEAKNGKYKRTTPRPAAAELSKHPSPQAESVEQPVDTLSARTPETLNVARGSDARIEEKRKKSSGLLSRFNKSS